MTASPTLFSPVRLGALALPSRIVMAPLTRSRAGAGDVPGPMNVEYYTQRASAGLIITEATQISRQGKGYAWTPGIHSDAQVAGWRRVTDAVHAAGGRIVVQLWHVGRISHPDLQENAALPVAPSAIRPEGQAFTEQGFKPMVTPRALTIEEIPGLIHQYAAAARRARDAGFDGVEVHGANGYLLDQFLRDKTNRRTDDYGGPVENRARLMIEAVEACIGVLGADRVGLRIAPTSPANDIADSDPRATFLHLAERLRPLGLAYLHVVEGATGGARDAGGADFDYGALKRTFGGPYVANNGYDQGMAEDAIAAGRVDAVAFGRPFIANPDLVARFRLGAALATPDRDTFYGGGEKGYTDYPAMAKAAE